MYDDLPMLPGEVATTPTITPEPTIEYPTIVVQHQPPEDLGTETFTFPRVLFPPVTVEPAPQIATPPFVEVKQTPDRIVLPPFKVPTPKIEIVFPGFGGVREFRSTNDDIHTAETETIERLAPEVVEAPTETFEGWTKKQLYARAKEFQIPGRSSMTKAMLIRALTER